MTRTILASALAFLAAVVVLFAAPAARADGFFITLSSNTVSTPRLAGAAFDSTSQPAVNMSTGAGTVSVTPVHVEVDDWGPAIQVLTMVTNNATVTATIDFTKPDASGADQVFLTATYKNAQIMAWTGTYTSGNPAVLTQAFNLLSREVAYTTPAPASGGASPAAPSLRGGLIPAKLAPLALSRALLATRLGPRGPVNDAVLTAPTNPAASAHISSFAFTITAPRDPQSGLATGRLTTTLSVVKPLDSSTAAFSNAANNRSVLDPVTIDLMSGATKMFTLTLPRAQVASDTTQVSNGVSSEAMSLSIQKITLQNRTTNATWAFSVDPRF
jgi:type VI protein secretion system component Hcp